MRVRSLAIAGILVAASLSVMPAATAAEPPGTGCPPGWSIAPVEILGDDFFGVADNVNADGLICIRILPSGLGIFIDNTVP